MNRSSFMRMSLVVFLLGLIVILSSVSWGIGAANAYLTGRGGGFTDLSEITIIFEGHINIFRWVGGILSALGGLGFIKAIELK